MQILLLGVSKIQVHEAWGGLYHKFAEIICFYNLTHAFKQIPVIVNSNANLESEEVVFEVTVVHDSWVQFLEVKENQYFRDHIWNVKKESHVCFLSKMTIDDIFCNFGSVEREALLELFKFWKTSEMHWIIYLKNWKMKNYRKVIIKQKIRISFLFSKLS